MCRFIAYLGAPVILYDLLYKPAHSLIKQSSHAREMEEPLNGDGFGVSWYSLDIDPFPGVFKSIQPAWNNINLEMLARKIQSGCFLAHVRAATQGSVSYWNTHPFYYEQYSFMHNGSIGGFNKIRRAMEGNLSEDLYHWVKGQTDSELFFAMILENLQRKNELLTLKNCSSIFKISIDDLLKLKEKFNVSDLITRINCVFTDGRQLFVLRYVSHENEKPNSLYYTEGHHILYKNGDHYFKPSTHHKNFVLVVSEILDQQNTNWQEVPTNHILTVDENLVTSIQPL